MFLLKTKNKNTGDSYLFGSFPINNLIDSYTIFCCIKSEAKKDIISVVIPVYKDLNGINNTLNSLVDQSLDKGKFEIIVASDGDDKDVADVCKKQ